MDEKVLEKMLDYAQAHGLGEMAVRMEFSLVLGPERIKLFAIEGDPQILQGAFKDMGDKYAEAKKGLQKVLDDLNEVETAVKAP